MVLRSKLTKILQWHRFFQCYNLNTLGLISSLLRIGLPAGQLSTSKHNPRWQRAKHSMCFAAVLWCTVQLCTCLKQASWDYVHASYLSSDLMFQLVSDVGAGQTSSVLCLSWGDPSVTKHQHCKSWWHGWQKGMRLMWIVASFAFHCTRPSHQSLRCQSGCRAQWLLQSSLPGQQLGWNIKQFVKVMLMSICDAVLGLICMFL